MAPSEGTAISMGQVGRMIGQDAIISHQREQRRTLFIWQGAVAGGAALGLGALAFYGLGMSSEVGAVDRAVGWPQYVKDRVRNPEYRFKSVHILN